MSQRNWQFHNPVSIRFGEGVLDELADLAGAERIVLVTTAGFRKRGMVDRVQAMLGKRLIAVVDDVAPNPDLAALDVQLQALRPAEAELLVALGGGSSLDSAKGLAKLLAQPERVSFLEHLREGRTLSSSEALPIVGIPTTAGTGAEVTPFATVWDFAEKAKHSVTGAEIIPAQAMLDPELTLSLPAETTLGSGLDAISHALESVWNQGASPVSLAFASASLRLSMASLQEVMADPGDVRARGDMLQASTLAGMAISQTRTALAHSVSYPLTAHFDLPHGFACSFTLPELVRFNITSPTGRDRLSDLASLLGAGSAEALADRLTRMFLDLGVPSYLAKYLPDDDAVLALGNQMIHPARAGNNLVPAGLEDVVSLVARSLREFAA